MACAVLLQVPSHQPFVLTGFASTEDTTIASLFHAPRLCDMMLTVESDEQLHQLVDLFATPGAFPELTRVAVACKPGPHNLLFAAALLLVCPPTVQHFGLHLTDTEVGDYSHFGSEMVRMLLWALQDLRIPGTSLATIMAHENIQGVPHTDSQVTLWRLLHTMTASSRLASGPLLPRDLRSFCVDKGAEWLLQALAPVLAPQRCPPLKVEQRDSISDPRDLQALLSAAEAAGVRLVATHSSQARSPTPRAETVAPGQHSVQLHLDSVHTLHNQKALEVYRGRGMLATAPVIVSIDGPLPAYDLNGAASIELVVSDRGMAVMPASIPAEKVKTLEVHIGDTTTFSVDNELASIKTLRLATVEGCLLAAGAFKGVRRLALQSERVEVRVMGPAAPGLVRLVEDVVEFGKATAVLLMAQSSAVLLHMLGSLLEAHSRQVQGGDPQRRLQVLGLGCLSPASAEDMRNIDTLLERHLGGGRVYFNSMLVQGGQAYVPPAAGFQQRYDVALGRTPLGMYMHDCPFDWLAPEP